MPLYFMPIDTDVLHERRRARYTDLLAPFGVTVMPYGNAALCAASSPCDAATDAEVSSKPDVLRVADDLERVPSADERQAFQAYLEAAGVPMDWVEADQVWRALVRGVLQMFLVAQRHAGAGAALPGARALRQTSLEWEWPIFLGNVVL